MSDSVNRIYLSGMAAAACVTIAGMLGCAQTLPQLYGNGATRSTQMQLSVVQNPLLLETTQLDASGSVVGQPTYSGLPTQFRFDRIDGAVPFILYWILEIEGPTRGVGDATFSVIPEGRAASTESVYTFSYGYLGQDDAPVRVARTAFGLGRTYRLRPVWENSLLQTNVTTSVRLSITPDPDDTTLVRRIDPRNPDDAQAYLTAKFNEAKGIAWGVDDTGRPGAPNPFIPIYPSTASAALLNPLMDNVRDTPTITFGLTSEATISSAE